MIGQKVKNKRVFITGGAGVIGLELIPMLINAGAVVFVADLKLIPEIFKNKVIYRQGDLNDMSHFELEAFNPDIIFHLAATFERSSETFEFWEENFKNNIRLSHHIMSIAMKCKNLKRFIFASSYLIYDQSLYQFEKPQNTASRLKEDDPIQPRNLTGMAKLNHEKELLFLNEFSQVQFTSVCVRIFRGYGKGSRDVISRWVRHLLENKEISIYKPEGKFDYINSKDSAEGLYRIANCKKATGIVNLGTGSSRSVNEIINILKTFFPNAKMNFIDSDINYEASEASTDELFKLIKWKPTLRLEQTIPEIIQYEKLRLSQKNKFNTNKIKTILITSASKKTPLVKCVKDSCKKISPEIKVMVGDMDSNAISRYAADEFWHMEKLETYNEQSLVQELKKRNINVILPTRDGELVFWSSKKQYLQKHEIHVIISELSAIEKCQDKLQFSNSLIGNHNVIPSYQGTNFEESKSYVVKERFGSGSRGISVNVSKKEALNNAKNLEHPIFQPFINGQEITIDAWIDKKGKTIGLVLRTRDYVYNGESQITTTFKNDKLEQEAKNLINAIGLSGPVNVQAIVTNEGLQFIECNPRFGGASSSSVAVGLDSFYWSLLEIIGEVDLINFKRLNKEIKLIRQPTDSFIYDTSI